MLCSNEDMRDHGRAAIGAEAALEGLPIQQRQIGHAAGVRGAKWSSWTMHPRLEGRRQVARMWRQGMVLGGAEQWFGGQSDLLARLRQKDRSGCRKRRVGPRTVDRWVDASQNRRRFQGQGFRGPQGLYLSPRETALKQRSSIAAPATGQRFSAGKP